MEQFKFSVEIINSQDWCSIIISALIPLLVMGITLFVSHWEQNRALKQQAEESKKQLDQQAKEHDQVMLEQKESVRLGLLPIFNLIGMSAGVEKVTFPTGMTLENHVFKLQVENIGSGIAISPYIKWDEIDGVMLNHPIFENETAYYRCYKDFTYDNMVAPPGKTVEVQIIRVPKDETSPIEDSFVVPIRFEDVLGNQYEQRIVISFFLCQDYTAEITNIASITPVLLKNEDDSKMDEGG